MKESNSFNYYYGQNTEQFSRNIYHLIYGFVNVKWPTLTIFNVMFKRLYFTINKQTNKGMPPHV